MSARRQRSVTVDGDAAKDIRAEIRAFCLSKAEGPDREIIQALYEMFDAHNAAFWQGKLEPVAILVSPPPSARAHADAAEFSGFGCRQQLRVRPSTARGWHNQDRKPGKKAFWRMKIGHKEAGRLAWLSDLVLHEMVHLGLNQQQVDGRHRHRGHGPVFAAECNRIGGLLGLPPVVSRRRKGDPKNLPIAPAWPMNVRPGGPHGAWYGDLWELVPAVDQVEEPFSGLAALCAVWEDRRTTDSDRERFLGRYGLRPKTAGRRRAGAAPLMVTGAA